MKTFLNYFKSMPTSGNLLYKALLERDEAAVKSILHDSKPEFRTICNGEGETHENIFELALWSRSITEMLFEAYPAYARISFKHLTEADLISRLDFAIDNKNISLLKVLLEPERRKFISDLVMMRVIEKAYLQFDKQKDRVNMEIVRTLISAICLKGIFLSDLLTVEFFGNDQKLLELANLYSRTGSFAVTEPLVCLPEDWRSAYQRRAATLFLASDIIKMRNNKFNDVDDNGRVARANKHFDEIVEPAFRDKFNSYGANDEQRIKVLEEHIRELILDYILEHSEPSDEVREFITVSRSVLIKGFPSAFQASVDFFSNSEDIGYSAWRAYNPFAPVAPGKFENLLTPQSGTPKAIFTIPGATGNLQNVTNRSASSRVRKQVAYYYLAVTDKTLPDYELCVGNFIGRLADIRNAHGLDSVSCFPGHIYRITEMGDFHPVAALSMTLQKQIEAFMMPKILEKFKEMLTKCESKQEREDLFKALITLRSFNAEAVFKGTEKVEYCDIVREGFERYLGVDQVEEALYGEFLAQHPNEARHPLGELNIYQLLLDPTYGSLLQPLIECYRKFCDMVDISSEGTASEPAAAPLACSSTSARYNPYEGHANHLRKLLARRGDPDSPVLNRLEIQASIFDELTLCEGFSNLTLEQAQEEVEKNYSDVIKWSTPSAVASSSSACVDDTPYVAPSSSLQKRRR